MSASPALEDAITLLRQHGISPSAQRLAIYKYLRENPVHPTVEHIFRQLSPDHPTLSHTTIYANLRLFAEKQLLLILNIEDGELRFDANTKFHAHFLCRKCRHVFDLMNIPAPPMALGENFRVESSQLNYYGLCPNCQEACLADN